MREQGTIEGLVEGHTLISDLENLFKRHLVLPTGRAFILSLYVLLTYVWDSLDYCPYLVITSPTKRCGKTSLAQLLEWLVNCPKFTVDATGPATFRLIEQFQPTLIFDEAEKYLADRGVRALLNAGFKSGTVVPRVIGGTVVEFKTYCPKVVCLIGGVPDTVLDRAVLIRMRRAKRNEGVEELRERTVLPVAAQLAADISQWIGTSKGAILEEYCRGSIPFLGQREANLWSPLFAIAAITVPTRLAELRTIALQMVTEKAELDTEAQAIQLLTDLRTILATEPAEQTPTQWLLSALKLLPESNWEKLSSPRLAQLLRPFDIQPAQIWTNSRNVRGYLLRDLVDAFERYLPAAANTDSQANAEKAA
jgi:hypothetical protein